MLDGHDGEDDRAPQAQKEGGPSKLECYFLLHTDKGKFWVAAKDVKRVDACQLPEVLTRPTSCKTEIASSRGLWAVGLNRRHVSSSRPLRGSPTWTLIGTCQRG